MSGIAGLVRLDGAPLGPPSIERMAQAIAHRGPDGNGSWTNGTVAFAHAMLHSTPESHGEAQPLADADLSIVADIRLDNRPELFSLLDIRRESIGDAALILAAYRRWGADCPLHLEGDYAFAIWNERERTLFCARDPFGAKAFVYALLPGKLFAFGSEVRALLALGEVPRDLDEKRIADFLMLHFDDRERTFHRALRRLPGGCSLTLRGGEVAIARTWFPENVAPLLLRGAGRDAEYAQGFLEHFRRAVRSCMRVSHSSELGAMMSGGLDSSSIACVARDELAAAGGPPLPIFSWVFSDVMEADEREYQQHVIAAGGFRPFTLDSAGVDGLPWANIDTLLPDGPPFAPNHYLTANAARLARGIGVRTLLEGLGGDITVSRGGWRFVELFAGGRLPTLARELRALGKRSEGHASLPRLFASNVLGPLAPNALRRLRDRLGHRGSHDDLKLLTPRMGTLQGAASAGRQRFLTVREQHAASYTTPLIAEGMELFDRFMAAAQVEARYPFFDKRLAEYCLSLPADQKMQDGYSRIVARRAMEGILPPAVQWRAGKGKPALQVDPALRASGAILDDLFVRDPSVLTPYVDIDVLRTRYAALRDGRPLSFSSLMGLWNSAVLALWLRRQAE